MSVQTVTLAGKRYVLMPETQFRRLRKHGEPELPKPDAKGNYPAQEALQVSIARSLLRRRLACGLSQQELARRAGIRAETLSRIESAKHSPGVATVEKLDRALTKAGAPDTAVK